MNDIPLEEKLAAIVCNESGIVDQDLFELIKRDEYAQEVLKVMWEIKSHLSQVERKSGGELALKAGSEFDETFLTILRAKTAIAFHENVRKEGKALEPQNTRELLIEVGYGLLEHTLHFYSLLKQFTSNREMIEGVRKSLRVIMDVEDRLLTDLQIKGNP